MLFCALASAAPAVAEVVAWSYGRHLGDGQDIGASREINIWVSAAATRVEDDHELVVIDYQQLVVQRLHKSSAQCRTYPLHPPQRGGPLAKDTPDTPIGRRMAELLGNFRVVATPHRQIIGGYPCQRKDIHYGLPLKMSAMVAPPVLERYGQRFSEAVEQHWLTPEITGLGFLRRVAAAHGAIFAANPLLRRLDPLGLLESLGGFSVTVSRKEPRAATIVDTLRTISLIADDPTLFRMPEAGRCGPGA